MPNPQKNNRAARKRLERTRRARQDEPQKRTDTSTSFVDLDIHREICYIIKRAQAEDSRIVALGEFVLFSTSARDAWLLDPGDKLALCLCRDGESQPFRLIDHPENFSIEWTAQFAIDGEAFVVSMPSGRIVSILGYPVAAISAACRGK